MKTPSSLLTLSFLVLAYTHALGNEITTSTLTSITTAPASSTPSLLLAKTKCDPTPYAHCNLPPSTVSPTPHFGPTSPATLRVDADALSAVLSALSSVTSTWTNGPLYSGLKSAVYEAAPTPIQRSLAISGYDWEAIVRSPWYTSAVPSQWQDIVTKQEQALQSVYDNVTRGHEVSSGGVRNRGRGGFSVWGISWVLRVVVVVGGGGWF